MDERIAEQSLPSEADQSASANGTHPDDASELLVAGITSQVISMLPVGGDGNFEERLLQVSIA